MSRARTRPLAVLALAVSVLAACSAPESTPVPTATSVPEATPTVTVFTLGTTVWFSGFVVKVVDATATIDEKGGPVELRLHVENASDAAASLDDPVRLTVGKTAFEPTRASVMPELAGGAAGDTTFTFMIAPGADPAKAVLRIGRTGDHQAVVPLAAASKVVSVTLEPFRATLKGTARGGDLRLRLSAAELRWDLVDWGIELPADVSLLTLTIDATYMGTFAGGFALTPDNVALRLPDGTLVAPRADGRSAPILALLPGKPVAKLSVRFEIPAGTVGSFALVAIDGTRTGRVAFTFPPRG